MRQSKISDRETSLFDLNEPPNELAEETDGVFFSQPLKATYSSNEDTSSNANPVLGFQPFIHPNHIQKSAVVVEWERPSDMGTYINSLPKPSSDRGMKIAPQLDVGAQSVEKEEGEWSDLEGSDDARKDHSLHENLTTVHDKDSQNKEVAVMMADSNHGIALKNVSYNSEGVSNESSDHTSLRLKSGTNSKKRNCFHNPKDGRKAAVPMDGYETSGFTLKQREKKEGEANHLCKSTNSLGKQPKLDHGKEAMLGKKRSRQTMFLDIEDVKQADSNKASTPRLQNFPIPVTTQTAKDAHSEWPEEKQIHPTTKDLKQVDLSSNERKNYVESNDAKSECNGNMNSGLSTRFRRLNGAMDLAVEAQQSTPICGQSSRKQPTDSRQLKNSQIFGRKPGLSSLSSVDEKSLNKKLPLKKQPPMSAQYQDTSVERLIREVTSEKLWRAAEDAELQCVPGQFASEEEYVQVFEPLLFEECRAQFYSAWEEMHETVSRDMHVMVRVKSIERRERGWYDVVLLHVKETKWTFKEGDVAVISSPRPGTEAVRSKRMNSSMEDDCETEVIGRVAGTVRRYTPTDTRDPPGAVLHFYVGGSYDSNGKQNDHILRKLNSKGIWFLTVLGSLATTQREYVALHAFHRLNLQMQSAILQPSSDHFPKYEEQTPAMPECFTSNFVDHLHRTFNGPQLAVIQWAATHTAAGITSETTKRQDPWPFTLVQGPPGTGKTHTVWGMLNVIHLVQYQQYYTALLKKLAPESYKQPNESNADNIDAGSIDKLLQNMDQNLFRSLPKLCPKPRMLVCAPSNAATDELLARVLDRGFIDGEMKVYRPDIARVGVASQTRAAQAVSVERRTEQLLMKTRDEVHQWMRQLRARETQLSQHIACLQRELNVTAAAGRAQGSVGIDPDVLLARDRSRDSLLQNLAAVVESRDKILVELSRLCILESKFHPGSHFNLEEARANLEASFANEAEIVFTTVSSSGRKLFSHLTHGFDMVVIDEAAQASEMAVLPPLSLGAARCVLVGDPQQLPATVISKAAGTLLYSRSLFERFQQAGCPTMLLSVQYRMHPQIRDFPSRYFYQGRLTDSDSVTSLPDELYYKDPLLRPYIFYDITHGRESHRGGSVSYQNVYEAQFCLRLYEHLQKTLKSFGVPKVTVGIITPYKLQLKCIQREFDHVLNSEEGKDLYVNTVDAFQGQERDIIIMSCVRASNHGVGFVADIRRMNVALTRARRALWVMGNANALMKSDDWAALITDAKARNCYLDMDSLPKDFQVTKTPSHSELDSEGSNTRGLRSALRFRSYDTHRESRQ